MLWKYFTVIYVDSKDDNFDVNIYILKMCQFFKEFCKWHLTSFPPLDLVLSVFPLFPIPLTIAPFGNFAVPPTFSDNFIFDGVSEDNGLLLFKKLFLADAPKIT